MAIVGLGIGLTFTCRFMRRKIWFVLDGGLARPNGGKALLARGGGVLFGFVVLVIALAWAIFSWWPPIARFLTAAGQPMLWLEGISIWPTIVLRIAIVVLCLLLLFHSRRWLNKDFWKLADEMKMEPALRRVMWAEEEIASTKSPWTRLVSYFNYRMWDDDRWVYADQSMSPYLLRFWGPYMYQSRSKARVFRVWTYVVIFFVLWGILELVFGNPPIPTRGLWAFSLYTLASWVLNVATLFLTLFVADATFLTWRVINALRRETDRSFEDTSLEATPEEVGMGIAAAATQAELDRETTGARPPDASNAPTGAKPSIWTDATLSKFGSRIGLPPADLEHWVDLVFLSKRTKTITTLIYLPFIIVALVIVSRSRLFANYAPSLPEILVMTLALLIVTVSAMALRQAAEASRAKAHRRLNDQIMLAKQSGEGESRGAQLELLSHRMDELNEGALTPFSQQPLLRAMLLPLGSFGGTALVEYLLLPGLS
jgi:multisubunit Na+/H+ antiporter MnhG subunit